MKERIASGKVMPSAPVPLRGGNNRRTSMIAAPYFVVDRFELSHPQAFSTAGKTSAHILVAIDGSAAIEAQDCAPVTLNKGDAIVIPASLPAFTVHPQPSIEFLKASVPATALPDPATKLGT